MKKPSIKFIALRNLIPFFLLFILILTIALGINFRDFSRSLVEDKILDIAKVVKAGLTSHMKAGIMDKRGYFLEEVTSNYDIQSIHIIRSKDLIKQYGTGNEMEMVPDAYIQSVLDMKKPFFTWQEFDEHVKIRAIIPYQATTQGQLNCLTCHNVPAGTVLGALDMEVDATSYRNDSITYIVFIVAILLLFSFLIIFNMAAVIERYIKKPLGFLITEAKASYKNHTCINTSNYESLEFETVAASINSFNEDILGQQEQLREKNTELIQLNLEIEATLKEAIFTMGQIEELRSAETRNHTNSVVELSRLLAESAGLGADDVKLITLASPIHDIGKLGIPDSILNKPGKLTEEERTVMKTHAQLGLAMLMHSDRDIMKAAGVIAYQHHERWDGGGYPQGLSGADIHIYARIVAIADVFDALACDRVYKKAWPQEEIVDFFKQHSGKHFDPALVAVMLENFDDMYAIIKTGHITKTSVG